MRTRGDIVKNPFVEALLKDPKNIPIALGPKISEVSWAYILSAFVLVYGTCKLAIPKQVLLDPIFVAAALELIAMPVIS
jgi:MFS transporter, MHS family, shikimate and dehydroshikimate transport protein